MVLRSRLRSGNASKATEDILRRHLKLFILKTIAFELEISLVEGNVAFIVNGAVLQSADLVARLLYHVLYDLRFLEDILILKAHRSLVKLRPMLKLRTQFLNFILFVFVVN